MTFFHETAIIILLKRRKYKLYKLNNKDDLANLVDKIVKFDKKIENWEEYAEEGMKAKVIKYSIMEDKETDGLFKIYFDFEPYDDHNRKYESANYYDKNHVACLTAREANFYTPQDWYYFDKGLEAPFNIVEE